MDHANTKNAHNYRTNRLVIYNIILSPTQQACTCIWCLSSRPHNNIKQVFLYRHEIFPLNVRLLYWDHQNIKTQSDWHANLNPLTNTTDPKQTPTPQTTPADSHTHRYMLNKHTQSHPSVNYSTSVTHTHTRFYKHTHTQNILNSMKPHIWLEMCVLLDCWLHQNEHRRYTAHRNGLISGPNINLHTHAEAEYDFSTNTQNLQPKAMTSQTAENAG